MRFFLLLFPTLLFAQSEVVKEQQIAERYIQNLYLADATEKFCAENPEKTYRTEYRGMPVEVDCEVRNKWVELYRKGEIEGKQA